MGIDNVFGRVHHRYRAVPRTQRPAYSGSDLRARKGAEVTSSGVDEGTIVAGARIRVTGIAQLGYIDRIEGRHAFVVLDNGEQLKIALDAGGLERDSLRIGAQVTRQDGMSGVVVDQVVAASVPTWQVAWADNSTTQVPERALRRAEISDPVARMQAGMLEDATAFHLRSVAADLWARNRSEQLVSLSHARCDLMPHQVAVLHRVVSSTPHRFLLCDEVGLGKTIEAAMVVKELRSRGLAQRVLILTPANIQRQWQYELKTKFNETFQIFNRETLRHLSNQNIRNPWHVAPSVITSHSFAAHNGDRRAEIAAVPWDLIIVDEAHHARRRRQGTRATETNLYRLVRDLTAEAGLGRRSVLFLTATPMQLQYYELFSLVELLHPSLFPSEQDFDQHINERAELTRMIAEIEKRAPTGSELDGYRQSAARWLRGAHADQIDEQLSAADLARELRGNHRLSEVMLRNRRAGVGGFMPRQASQWNVALTPQERGVHSQLDSIVRDGYAAAAKGVGGQANAVGFLMVIYEKLAASSSRALLRTLERRRERLLAGSEGELTDSEAEEDLDSDAATSEVTSRLRASIDREADRIGGVIDILRQIPLDSKAKRLREGLRELNRAEPDAKVLIFTEFRETQEMLRELLIDDGWGCQLFHGQLAPDEKDRAVQRFRDSGGPQALVATEAGGEGRNLQFAHILVNYDLPWNPMRVEQRIGRIDRIGQGHPVQIFNFRVVGTIEERILEVLDERIGLFESAVGGLESILGEAEDDIRAALRQGAEKRDEELGKMGLRLEQRMQAARQADDELSDLNLDTRDYRKEIDQIIGRATATTICQEEVDLLLANLLASANATVTPPGDGMRFPRGQRRIDFGPPFTEDERELLDGQEQRLVCFDPSLSVDSATVEYFGFGHPIVDSLVRRATRDHSAGSAAIRYVARRDVASIRDGWQFNWRLRLTAAESREWVFPVFVDDMGGTDDGVAEGLLVQSRRFSHEIRPTSDDERPHLYTLDSAFRVAQQAVLSRRDALEAEYRQRAAADFEVAHDRLQQLHDYQSAAAQERLHADHEVLNRMSASKDAAHQRVIPIWQFHVRRAKEEIEQVEVDHRGALDDLLQSRNPSVEYDLLNVARIQVTT